MVVVVEGSVVVIGSIVVVVVVVASVVVVVIGGSVEGVDRGAWVVVVVLGFGNNESQTDEHRD